MSEISVEMGSSDGSKAPIKQSLLVVNREEMSKKLSKSFQTYQQNSHLMPFKVNYNELTPHLSHSSLKSNYKTSHENHRIRSAESPLLGTNGFMSNLQMRRNSSSSLRFPPNDSFRDMSQTYSDSNWSLNSLQLDSNKDIQNLDSMQRSQSQLSINSNIFKDNECLNRNKLSPNLSRLLPLTLNHSYSQSCPSSPLMHRYSDYNSFDLNQSLHSQTFNSMKSIASKCIPTIGLTFDRIHGSEVVINEDFTKAERLSSTGLTSNSYAFISEQIRIGVKITIEVIALNESNESKASFIFGLTNANPSKLTHSDLPNDAQELIQRKHQFWTLVDHFCDNCNISDKMSFLIDSKGFVFFWINCNRYTVLFPIKNAKQDLWAFFNIIGRIKAIKLVNNYSNNTISNMMSNQRKLTSKLHLYKCINCFSDYANTAFYKCGHKYYCFNCAKIFFNSVKKCPFCYQLILDLVIIFP